MKISLTVKMNSSLSWKSIGYYSMLVGSNPTHSITISGLVRSDVS